MSIFGDTIRGIKPLAQGAGSAAQKALSAAKTGAKAAGHSFDSAVKGKLRGKHFATKNIKGTLNKEQRFQKFARQSFTGNKLEGVVIEDPSGTGLYRYDSNAVPYDNFNRNELSRRMTRSFKFNSDADVMPYNPYGRKK